MTNERLDIVVREPLETRHPRTPDRSAAVLDEIEKIAIRLPAHAGAIGEVAGPDEKQRRAPGSSSVRAVTGRAERDEQPLAAPRADVRLRRLEEPRHRGGKEPDRNERDAEHDDRSARHAGNIGVEPGTGKDRGSICASKRPAKCRVLDTGTSNNVLTGRRSP